MRLTVRSVATILAIGFALYFAFRALWWTIPPRTPWLLVVAVLLFLGWRIAVLATTPAERQADVVQQVFSTEPLPPFTPEHLALVRGLQVWWLPVESGAPGVDPRQPLRGVGLR